MMAEGTEQMMGPSKPAASRWGMRPTWSMCTWVTTRARMWVMEKSMARSPALARCFSSWPWNRPQSMRMPDWESGAGRRVGSDPRGSDPFVACGFWHPISDRGLSPRGLTPMAPDSALPIRSSWQEPVTPLTAPWCKISIIQHSLLVLPRFNGNFQNSAVHPLAENKVAANPEYSSHVNNPQLTVRSVFVLPYLDQAASNPPQIAMQAQAKA